MALNDINQSILLNNNDVNNDDDLKQESIKMIRLSTYIKKDKKNMHLNLCVRYIMIKVNSTNRYRNMFANTTF